MQIVAIGRGNVGGGLVGLWEAAGHDCTSLGHDGGDASAADVILVAVPGKSIADAFSKVSGFEGKTAIDATNVIGGRDPEFPSNAPEAREVTEQLNRDAGYDPVYIGDLDQARTLEEALKLVFAVSEGGMGSCFYRFAAPGDL
jgi:predicted dinucleotide-binding enzyme